MADLHVVCVYQTRTRWKFPIGHKVDRLNGTTVVIDITTFLLNAIFIDHGEDTSRILVFEYQHRHILKLSWKQENGIIVFSIL